MPKGTRLRLAVPTRAETSQPEKTLGSALVSLLGRKQLAAVGLMGRLTNVQASGSSPTWPCAVFGRDSGRATSLEEKETLP